MVLSWRTDKLTLTSRSPSLLLEVIMAVVRDTALAASTEVEQTMEVVSIMAVASNDDAAICS
jgi:hypothetical protein